MIGPHKSQIIMHIIWYNTIALFYNISKVHSIRELKSYLTLVHVSMKSPRVRLMTCSDLKLILHLPKLHVRYPFTQLFTSGANSLEGRKFLLKTMIGPFSSGK